MTHQTRSLKLLSLITSLSILFGLLVVPTSSVSAALTLGDLTVTPLTWNVIGLDSNDQSVGPDTFPVGARVCNYGDSPALNVQASYVWDGPHDYIDLRSGSYGTGGNPYPVVPTISNVAPDNCHDFYFEVVIDRTSAAFDSRARYHIEFIIPGLGTLSTPTPRELYVERLISQSRNATFEVRLDGVVIPPGGTMPLLLGGTYDITLVGYTATGGYEQIESYINFPNTIFSINEVSTTHSTINDSTPDLLASSRLYADGCTWENNPNSPNYRSCLGTGKYGNVVTVTYNVTIIGVGGVTENLNNLIYDFSGSSYHYNSDYPVDGRIAAIIDPTNLSITKDFVPSSITPGDTSSLTIRVTNPNGGEISGVNFTDPFPTNVVANGAPTLYNCGVSASAYMSGTTLHFVDGTLPANGTCVIKVPVTSTINDTYVNTTDPVFVDSIDTDQYDDATLIVEDQVRTCTPGQTLVTWTVPVGSTNPPDTASGSAGSPTINNTGYQATSSALVPTNTDIATSGYNDNASWSTYGYKTAPFNHVQFVVDTRLYSNVVMNFHVLNASKANGPTEMTVSYNNGTGFVNLPAGTLLPPDVQNVWTPASIDFTGLTSTSGSTTFRIAALGAKNDNSGAGLNYDVITFTGCRYYPPPPRIEKSFSPDPIAVGEISTLTFTINNDKSYNEQLTGITFSDVLPVGLSVSDATLTSQCNGTGTVTTNAATGTISLTGASLAAGGSCSFSIPVTGSAPGYYDNISTPIDSTESDPNTGADGTATDTLLVLSPPEIEKVFAASPILTGSTTTLSFTITNPNSTASLSGLAFTDPLPAGISVPTSGPTSFCGGSLSTTSPSTILFSGGFLAAGDSCTFNVTVTGAAVGAWHNVTTAMTSTDGGTGNTAEDDLIVRDPVPAINLLKQVGLSSTGPWYSFVAVPLPLPRDVYFKFIVENTGDMALSNVSIDDSIGGLDLSDCVTELAGGLAIYETIECVSGAESVTVEDSYSNTAHATSDQADSDDSIAIYATPELTIVKNVTETYYLAVGDILHYTYDVTNTGFVPLVGPVVIMDDRSNDESCPDVNSVVPDGDGYLDPGETIQCTATYTIQASDISAGSVTNIAQAIVGGEISGTDTETVPLLVPSLTTDKAYVGYTDNDTSGDITAGDDLNYTVTMTNTGNTTLTNVVVSDAELTPTSQTCLSVAPLGTCVLTGSYTVLQSDVDAGSFVNVASVTDDDVCTVSPGPECTDTVTVPITAGPAINIRKNIEGPDSQVISTGSDVTFTIRVTNTGDVTLNVVTVTDPLAPDCAATGLGPILPGDYVEYLCTVLNVTAGFTNTATTQGVTSTGITVTNSDDSTVLIAAVGDLSLTKTLTDTNQDFTDDNNVAIGEIITYQVSVVVPPGSFSTTILTDTMDRGLAFVGCTAITGPVLTTSIGTLTDVCNNAVGVTYLPSSTDPRDEGRQAVFNFGMLTNPTTSAVTMLVNYEAVVLNSLGNTNGLDLGNQASLTWGVADSAGPVSAEDVNIIEPRLNVIKTASPTLVAVGTEVTFTLTLTHDSLFSTTDAFNVELIDQLPIELGNVTALNCTTGAQDPSTCTYSLATHTMRAVWPVFTRTGGNSIITFRATVLSLPASNEITNSVTGEWTSLPDDVSEPQTVYNDLSDERTFPPGIDVDNYIDTDEIILRPAGQPSTGFAPGRITPLDITTRTTYESLGELSVEVPNLGILLPVVGVPLEDRSWDLTWLWGQAGWLEETAYPTWKGNSVITAHVYLPNGKPGPFLNLGNLTWGDQIIVHTNGMRYIYQVRSVTTVKSNDMSAFKHEEKSWITLVTCKDYDAKTDTYKKRIVVKAILIDVTDELSNSN